MSTNELVATPKHTRRTVLCAALCLFGLLATTAGAQSPAGPIHAQSRFAGAAASAEIRHPREREPGEHAGGGAKTPKAN